jgi:hypothetical protein
MTVINVQQINIKSPLRALSLFSGPQDHLLNYCYVNSNISGKVARLFLEVSET